VVAKRGRKSARHAREWGQALGLLSSGGSAPEGQQIFSAMDRPPTFPVLSTTRLPVHAEVSVPPDVTYTLDTKCQYGKTLPSEVSIAGVPRPPSVCRRSSQTIGARNSFSSDSPSGSAPSRTCAVDDSAAL